MTQSGTFNQRFPAGSSTLSLPNSTAVFTTADITVNRAANGGLDSLPTGSVVDVAFDYSLDGGTTWAGCGGAEWDGGPLPPVVKNGQTFPADESEELAIGIGEPFPVGTAFRVRVTTANAVRLSGTVTYS